MIRITMQNGKTIDIELDHSAAPITCENFEKLVKDGFYNGLTFHRVISGFMIQGGDPQGTGAWAARAGTSRVSFCRTALPTPSSTPAASSAWPAPWIRTPPAASSSSCTRTPRHLDGSYAAFGHVVKGIEVVDEIAAVATDWNDKPRTPVVMEKVEIV